MLAPSIREPLVHSPVLRPVHSRIPELDGLRGLAILMVLCYHFSIVFGSLPAPFSHLRTLLVPGWTGVDLFFVLSGFLITGILLDAKGSPQYFRNFYTRRVLRIFPVYYAALIPCLIFGAFLLPAFDASAPVRLTYLLHLSNWLSLGNLEIAPLDHFWSLAVEEQFYLCWPVAVWLLTRKSLARLCGLLILLAPVIRFALLSLGPGGAPTPQELRMAFVLTPARADTLAWGALLALLVRNDHARQWMGRRAAPLFALGCAVLVGWFACKTRLGLDRALPQSLLPSLVGITYGLALLNLIHRKSTALGAVFRRPLLRTAGRYSYAAYVVHFPLLAATQDWVLRAHSPAFAGLWFLSGIALTFLIAAASWRFLELPLNRLKDRIA